MMLWSRNHSVWYLTGIDLPHVPDPGGRTDACHRDGCGLVPGWSWAGGMILPWLIGQAFVQVGAGAMMVMIFIGSFSTCRCWSFSPEFPQNRSSVPNSTAIAD